MATFPAEKYRLRWKQENDREEWGPFYEISSEPALTQVRGWIQLHEAAIRASAAPLDMIPGWEFFGIKSDRVKYYPLVAAVPADGRPKAERAMRVNISSSDLESLKELFARHGSQTPWEPPWGQGKIE